MANSNRVGGNPEKKPAASAAVTKKRDRRPVSHTSSLTSLTVLRGRLQHLTRWFFIGLGLVMVIGIGVSMPNARMNQNPSSQDVAKVEGETVDRTEFEKSVRQTKDSPYAMYMGGGGPMQDLAIRNMVLDQNVDHIVKLKAAHSERNRVGRKQLKDKIEQALDSLIQEQKNYYKFDKDKGKAFREKFLKKMKVANEEELRKKLRGDLDPDWLSSTREQILIENLEKKIKKQAAALPIDKAKPEDIEVHTRQIVIQTTQKKRSDAAAKKMAQALLAQVKGGADFAKVAKEKSEDDYTKTKGGDMDWMGKGRFYPTEVEKPAMELKVGEISGLVKSTQGYHIVKVEGRRFSPDKHWTTYVEGQKKKAKIEVMDPALAAYRQVSEDEGKAQKALADAKSDADRKKAEDLQKQNRAKALAAYEKAVEKSEDPYLRAALLYAMGEMHTKDGNTTKAAEMFAAATDAMPSADIYMALGDAQHKLKKDAAAVESYKQASEMAQDTSQSMGRQNEGLHLRLMTAFKDLKQPQLAAQESAWLAKYRQEQAASGGGMGGFPGGSFTVGN